MHSIFFSRQFGVMDNAYAYIRYTATNRCLASLDFLCTSVGTPGADDRHKCMRKQPGTCFDCPNFEMKGCRPHTTEQVECFAVTVQFLLLKLNPGHSCFTRFSSTKTKRMYESECK